MGTSSLKRLSENIFYLPFGENDRPTLAAISGSQQTLLVDAGNSPAHAELFLSELSNCNISPIKYVTLTHWHWDHVFGLVAMNAISIAHQKTKEKMIELKNLAWDNSAIDKRFEEGTENIFVKDTIKQEYPDPNRVIQVKLPEIAFIEKIEIKLGEIDCLIEHVGGDHSPDSSVVVIPKEKVAFIGDCIYPNPYGKVCGKPEYTSKKLFPLINKLLGYDIELYVDSHDKPIPKKEFKKRCQLLQDVGSLVEVYENQNNEIMRELENKAKMEGITIDNSWSDEIQWIIQAFQAGLDL